jgi:tetratricopeptide (TPR) repeat protein
MHGAVMTWRAVHARGLLRCVGAAVWFASHAVQAEPVNPTRDGEVVQVLPSGGVVSDERRLRRLWLNQPTDAVTAASLATRYLARAREDGDPRYAGQALAVLQPWPHATTAPDEVLLLQATVQQYLHQFEVAAAHLETLVARRPAHGQAWLTLATVRRVQGRYAASDLACSGLLRAGVRLEGQACLAENAGLRGEVDAARRSLRQLLDQPRLTTSSRSWLLTTLAELEQRNAQPAAAESAFKQALDAESGGYTLLTYVDFLMDMNRHADALAWLQAQPRTDAVLLRLAMAGARLPSPAATKDATQVRDAMAQANLRPDARGTHAREQAMFALWVDAKPVAALALARINVRSQREPLDVLVLAHAARASGDAKALREADQLRKEMGLHDRRLDALL